MKISTKKDGDCRIKLTITAPAEETSETYGKILNKYLRNSQIRGFRKGKAPKEIVLNAYGPQIDAEVKSDLCGKLINKAIEEEKLDVAAVLGVTELNFTPEAGLDFTALVDLNPEFKTPKYKGLSVKYEKPVVTDEEVASQLENYRGMLATTKESDDPMKEGDYANISFESDIAAPESADDPAARYIKNENFWLQVGEKPGYEAIPGSAKALLGLKKGDSFSFKAQFADDFSAEFLRGKKGTYKGTILKVNALVPASDEDVCKMAGAENIDDLRTRLRAQMEGERDFAERSRLHGEIEGLLSKKATFDVPESAISAAARACGEGVVSREIQGKVTGKDEVENYVKDHADELRQKIDEEAARLVRLNYIGRAIAKELDITATEKDVRAVADAEAAQYARRDPSVTGEKLFANIVKNGLVGYWQDRIRFRRVLDWIIDNDVKAAK